MQEKKTCLQNLLLHRGEDEFYTCMWATDEDCCTYIIFFNVKFAEFDEIMHSDPESLKNIISKVLTWLIRTRWRRAIWGTLSVIKCKCGCSVQQNRLNLNHPCSLLVYYYPFDVFLLYLTPGFEHILTYESLEQPDRMLED